MSTTEAQQLDRCARALRRAEQSLPLDNPLRLSALMDAQDEISDTIRRVCGPRPRVSPAVMAVLGVCWAVLFVAVGLKTVVLLTEGRPVVEQSR